MAETVGLIALEAAGFSAAEALTPLFFGVTGAALTGSAILAGGSVALSLLMSPSVQAPTVPKPGDGTQTLKLGFAPRLFGYGRCRIAGAYVAYDSSGDGLGDSDPNKNNSYDILAMHHGRIGGFVYFYLNDDLVTVDPNTFLVNQIIGVTDTRYTLLGSVTVKIEYRLGETPESYYQQMIDAFSDGRWTTDHRGDGIASIMFVCSAVPLESFPKVYPRGLPRLSAIADLLPVHDPRLPAENKNDPTTWQGWFTGVSSRNPVLQLIDFLTSTEHGLGLDWSTLIAPIMYQLKAQADICDERVARIEGTTEPRYASSGFAYLTTDPVEVIAAILATCDGWMAEGPGGTLALWVGKYQGYSVTLTDDHIVGFTLDKGVPDEEVVNEIRWTFTPPANDYREAAGIPWRDAADVAERGYVRAQSLSLTWVQSHAQGRRLAKRAMARHMANVRGSMTTTLYGLKCLGQRWVHVRSRTIADLSDTVIEITKLKVDLANARVAFDWVVVNTNTIDAWDPASEQGTTPPFPGKLSLLGATA